jgi:hypothetical protein
MNILDIMTRKPIVPVTLVKEMPFNPVISTTAEQDRAGTLGAFALDFLLVLKEAGCEPSEVFAVASIMESMTRDWSHIVDTGPDECDLVWKEML